MFSAGGGPAIRVCCGPRCGVEPCHRAVFDAAERLAPPGVIVAPTLCRGLCGGGVTLVREDGRTAKAADARDVEPILRAATAAQTGSKETP
jgi:hypothetical protein